MENRKQSPCPTCGGSGQVSFFMGESRFLLSSEECQACCGLGYLLEGNEKNQHRKTTTEEETETLHSSRQTDHFSD
jgi:DnaJ-class molecular chaperone